MPRENPIRLGGAYQLYPDSGPSWEMIFFLISNNEMTLSEMMFSKYGCMQLYTRSVINYTGISLWGQSIPTMGPWHVAVPIPNPVYGALFLLPPGRVLDVLCVVSSGFGFPPAPSDCCPCIGVMRR